MCYGKCSSVGCANEAVFCDRDNVMLCEVCYHEEEMLDEAFSDGEDDLVCDDEYEYDDSMDGDHASGLASAGWGTDEDYDHYDYYGDNDSWE